MGKSTINHHFLLLQSLFSSQNPSQSQPIPGAAGAPGGSFRAGEFAQLRAGGAGRVGGWESLDLQGGAP